MTSKRSKSKKKTSLHGRISSGMIFIGDPSFLSGPSDMALNEKGEVQNNTPIDPFNPFRRSEDLLDKVLESGDTEVELLPFVPGRGAVILTNGIQEGSYTVKKKIDKISGKVTRLVIDIKG